MMKHPALVSWLRVLAIVMCAGVSAPAAAQTNPIQIENTKAGSTD